MLLLSTHPLPGHSLQLQEVLHSSGTLIRSEADLVPCQKISLVLCLLVAANRLIGGRGLFYDCFQSYLLPRWFVSTAHSLNFLNVPKDLTFPHFYIAGIAAFCSCDLHMGAAGRCDCRALGLGLRTPYIPIQQEILPSLLTRVSIFSGQAVL